MYDGEERSGEKENQKRPTRRAVLEGTAKYTIAATAVAAGTNAATATAGEPLEGTRVYTDGVSAAIGSAVDDVGDADLAVFDSARSPNRPRVLEALHDGTSIGFVGEHAQDATIGFLHGISRSQFAHRSTDSLERPTDLDFTFGFELDDDDDGGLMVVNPRDGYLDIRNVRANEAPSDRELAITLEDSMETEDEATVQSGWDANWERVGTQANSDSYCPYGQWARNLDVRKYEDSWNWVAIHLNHRMTAGLVSPCSSDWQNLRKYREFDFPSYYTLWDYGPESSTGQTSTSVSISSGGDVGASWSYSTADVEVRARINETASNIDWTHYYTTGTQNAESTHTSKPTPLLRLSSTTNTVNYEHDTRWRWVDEGFWGDDEFLYTQTGDGTWYL